MRKGRFVGRGATCDYSVHGLVSYGHAFGRMDALLRNDSRRLTPGGAPPMLYDDVCVCEVYAMETGSGIQDAAWSSTRGSTQELCRMPNAIRVSR